MAMDLAPVIRSPYHSGPSYQVTNTRSLFCHENENDAEDIEGRESIDQSQQISLQRLFETGHSITLDNHLDPHYQLADGSAKVAFENHVVSEHYKKEDEAQGITDQPTDLPEVIGRRHQPHTFCQFGYREEDYAEDGKIDQ